MATITLRTNYSCTYVGVPNIFIDNYMADANGEFVKVYLYLLRCMNSNGGSVSISAIADYFNNTEKDVMRALKYWEKVGVLSLELDNNRLVGLCLNDLNAGSDSNEAVLPATALAPTVAVAPVPQAASAPLVIDAPTTAASNKTNSKATVKKREYSLDEVKAFCNNHEVSELLFIIETYLKHPLNSTEMNTVFFWYDTLHFSGELIEYLVEYCITNGHSSLRYMDKVALGWSENGIDTIDKAKEHVSIRSKAYYSIMKAFGISGRNLADSEMTFVNKWTKEYNFDTELIQEACKRTISATQKPSFEYADSILTNWYNNNVHTLKDVTALDEAFNKTKRSNTGTSSSATTAKKNKFNNFNQRAYDPDALEKVLLTTSV
ncbi:MAG: DnaD domain protein [Agathobacter sp.]|nr:DnaD domain protein [Agathobacter sp.]